MSQHQINFGDRTSCHAVLVAAVIRLHKLKNSYVLKRPENFQLISTTQNFSPPYFHVVKELVAFENTLLNSCMYSLEKNFNYKQKIEKGKSHP